MNSVGEIDGGGASPRINLALTLRLALSNLNADL
jgi:hypothetical protein